MAVIITEFKSENFYFLCTEKCPYLGRSPKVVSSTGTEKGKMSVPM